MRKGILENFAKFTGKISNRILIISFEFTPTETSAGGTLLFIANHLSYKCRNGLNVYKKNELESTFTETVNPRKSNIIVGVIYRHPSMDLTDFNSQLLKQTIRKYL